MRLEKLFGSGPATLAADVVVATLVVLFIALGLAVTDAAEELTTLSDGVSDAGGAVTSSGEAIGGVDVPVVGEQLAGAGEEIRMAGEEVQRRGDDSREQIEDFARLLGLVVAGVPMLLLLGYYLPPRLSRAGEVRALKSLQRIAGDDPRFVEFLARRAAEQLPYRRLRRISDRPWADLDEGRHSELAKGELRRMGVMRTRL